MSAEQGDLADLRCSYRCENLASEVERLRGICHQRGERIARLEAELAAAHHQVDRYRAVAHAAVEIAAGER